ncbi:MAG: DUF2497 domain-containing protein [Rhodoblastus sp.]
MTAANAPFNPVPIPASVESERRAHEPSMEEILASIRKIIADDDALPLSRTLSPPRLFETNVATFAPPAPVPAPAEETEDEAPVEPPATESLAADLEDAVETAVDEGAPATVAEIEYADIRLEEAEMASFADRGREWSQSESQDADYEPEEGGDPAPASELADPAFADDAADMEVSPVPHDEAYDERAAAEPQASHHAEFVDDGHAVHAASLPADAGAILSAEANASVASAFQALSASVQMAGAESIDRHVREMLRPMLKQWLDDNLPVMVERLVRAEIERVARGGR